MINKDHLGGGQLDQTDLGVAGGNAFKNMLLTDRKSCGGMNAQKKKSTPIKEEPDWKKKTMIANPEFSAAEQKM